MDRNSRSSVAACESYCAHAGMGASNNAMHVGMGLNLGVVAPSELPPRCVAAWATAAASWPAPAAEA
jgi:hypothetical protein